MFKPQPLMFVLLTCVACGGSFEPAGSGGAGSSGATSNGGESQAGAGAVGGESSAGESAGGASSAGETSSGGHATAGGGGAAHGGAAHGGAASGGASAGGANGGNGSAGAAGTDCAALKTEYAALVKKARVCDEGSTDQCSTSSKAPNVGGCGCPTLVNANSEYTALAAEKYKAIQKNNCDNGPICGIACLAPTSASCAQSSGMGPSEFVCTGTNGGIAN